MDRMIPDITSPKKISFALATLIFVGMQAGAMIGSLAMKYPLVFTVSCFSFITSFVAVIHDHWVLNSLMIPLAPVFVFAFLNDLFTSWTDLTSVSGFISFLGHFTTFVLCMALFVTRKDTSLLLMIGASLMFPLWMVCVQQFIDPYYAVSFFGTWTSPQLFFYTTACACITFSVVATIKNAQFSRAEMKCEKGWCPL